MEKTTSRKFCSGTEHESWIVAEIDALEIRAESERDPKTRAQLRKKIERKKKQLEIQQRAFAPKFRKM